jgi:hypothetical protein
MISVSTARELLDFAGGAESRAARIATRTAEGQLEGAVAIHNILEQTSVAYLADEVGLGKTYVALGAFALFRHFNPTFRLLVIAPSENIQRKWIKEMQNFVRNNVRFPDLRVKSIHGVPARPSVYCGNLYELVRETSLDPDRDFFARLTSFSFGMTEDREGWNRKRDAIRQLIPWIHDHVFDLRSKDLFKQNYARVVCCAIPTFDLVIVDEGHKLKSGLSKSSTMRNRLVAQAFGNDPSPLTPAEQRRFPHYQNRAQKLLFLSATPIEDDYRQIWNQLDVFGRGDATSELADRDLPEREKRKVVSTFLIRRVSQITTNETDLTKNLYRREWRRGGVNTHDEPLPQPNDRQRLLVALVQKKVSELLDKGDFKPSFQIGMLASFESFLQTAKVTSSEKDTGIFDDSDQTEDELERQGIDVNAVNKLSENYRKNFGHPMPHPKMDALVESLKTAFDTGRKALVFVRRVASVKEIKEKLDAAYDEWLFARLRSEVRQELQPRLHNAIELYSLDRQRRRSRALPNTEPLSPEEEEIVQLPEDSGGDDTFFSWFFRGDGPQGWLSGAAIAKRFNQSRYALSSFFADNYVAELLGVAPGRVFEALAETTGIERSRLQQELEARAGCALRSDQKKRGHFDLFFAFQEAAVSLLAEGGPFAERARVVQHQLFTRSAGGGEPVPLRDWLEVPTFFTRLRTRPVLRNAIWPAEDSAQYAAEFRRRELRRESIASLFRLGHAFIDLYVEVINQLGRLDTKGTEGEDLQNDLLATAVLDRLEQQRDLQPFRAFHELQEAASHFDAIIDTNVPSLWDSSLDAVPTEIGKLLRAQQPIGGMSGQVNKTLVAQFRMPAYPLVMVTTDLLQEGEDLHLFCSDIYHYGISWMPSSMEQRIGRIDRVRSQTERRLTALDRPDTGDDRLQVFYPFVPETIEVFQVNRVLDRMARFIRLMHDGLGVVEENETRRIDLIQEMKLELRAEQMSTVPLQSAFPVQPWMIEAPARALAVSPSVPEDLLQRFWVLQDVLGRRGVTWDAKSDRNARVGHLNVGDRKQVFTLLLHTIAGRANLRCVSPIGMVDLEANQKLISDATRLRTIRIAVVYDIRFKQYNLTAEADVLLSDSIEFDDDRSWWLVESTAKAADDLEAALFPADQDITRFRNDLDQEPTYGR